MKCMLLLAAGLLNAQAAEKPPAFDAASIKPHSASDDGATSRGGITMSKGGGMAGPPGGGFLSFTPGRVFSARQGVTARKLILEAYRLTPYQLSGGPAWLDSEAFDIEAKAEAAGDPQLRQMLQTLLADRFRLAVHRETKEMPVYALTAGKNGSKLRDWKPGEDVPMPAGGHPYNYRGAGTMQQFADFLSNNAVAVGRPVVDKTDIGGTYAFLIGWDAPEDFISAMQEQLGLKLEPQKATMDAVAIERIDKPSAN